MAPAVIGGWSKEKEHGCDILSTPPEGGEPHRVEVKGWGEPMLTPKGKFTYGQDIRVSQFEAAKLDPNYRIEIVSNLDGYLRGEAPYQRLTLTAEQIRARAIPRSYDIPLDGLADYVRTAEKAPHPAPPASDGRAQRSAAKASKAAATRHRPGRTPRREGHIDVMEFMSERDVRFLLNTLAHLGSERARRLIHVLRGARQRGRRDASGSLIISSSVLDQMTAQIPGSPSLRHLRKTLGAIQAECKKRTEATANSRQEPNSSVLTNPAADSRPRRVTCVPGDSKRGSVVTYQV